MNLLRVLISSLALSSVLAVPAFAESFPNIECQVTNPNGELTTLQYSGQYLNFEVLGGTPADYSFEFARPSVHSRSVTISVSEYFENSSHIQIRKSLQVQANLTDHQRSVVFSFDLSAQWDFEFGDLQHHILHLRHALPGHYTAVCRTSS